MSLESAVFLECIQEMIRGISSTLAGQGFSEPETRSVTTDRLVKWQRGGQWKHEVVQLSHALQMPRSVSIGLMIYVPCRADGEEVLLDGRTVEALVARSDTYVIPSLLTKARCGGLVRTIRADLAKGLSWFEGFVTPAQALTRLEAGLTNHGNVRSRAYEDLAAYLRLKSTES